MAIFGDLDHAVAGARLDQAALGAYEDVAWAGRAPWREPERYGSVLGVGDVKICPRVTCPEVPEQRLSVLAHAVRAKRGGFEQRLGGA